MADNTTRPGSLRSRIGLIAAFAAVLAAGVGSGVLLERYGLRPARTVTADPRLVGRWVDDEDKTPLEFKTDGTFEYVRVTKTEVPEFGPRPGDIEKKKVTLEDPVTGQYRWVNAETVELLEPGFGDLWSAMRFVIEGDRLTLLRTDGSVRRFTRSR